MGGRRVGGARLPKHSCFWPLSKFVALRRPAYLHEHLSARDTSSLLALHAPESRVQGHDVLVSESSRQRRHSRSTNVRPSTAVVGLGIHQQDASRSSYRDKKGDEVGIRYPQRFSWLLAAVPWAGLSLIFLPGLGSETASQAGFLVLNLTAIIASLMSFVPQRRHYVVLDSTQAVLVTGGRRVDLLQQVVRAVFQRKTGIAIFTPQAAPAWLRIEKSDGSVEIVPLWFTLSLLETRFMKRWRSDERLSKLIEGNA